MNDNPFTSAVAGEFYGGPRVYTDVRMPAFKPKLQLTPGSYVSDEFRRDMDRWLAERFGTYPYVIVTYPVPGSGLPYKVDPAILCNPQIEAMVRRRIESDVDPI